MRIFMGGLLVMSERESLSNPYRKSRCRQGITPTAAIIFTQSIVPPTVAMRCRLRRLGWIEPKNWAGGENNLLTFSSHRAVNFMILDRIGLLSFWLFRTENLGSFRHQTIIRFI
jgi:hypothetical protein